VTRAGQIIAALELLGPPPPRRREDRRRHVEHVVDEMESVRRAAEHAKVTRKRMRTYSAALRKFQAASRAHAAAGGSLALSQRRVDRAVALDEEWSAHWHPPSPWLEHKTAVEWAYKLLGRWNPHDIVVSRVGTWHKLSAVLFGNRRANLYRHLRAFAAENKIRSRRK
jgi:hypothetical protein